MAGQALLVPFGGPAIRATAKRNPPSRAEPMLQQTQKISSGTNKRRGIALRGYPLYELMFQQTRKRAAARKCKQAARSIRQTPSPLPLSQRERG